MQGAGAPRGQGQAPAGVGTLGRPGVLLLTYVLTTLDLTCLFMQFSVLPVSTLPSRRPAPPRPPVHPQGGGLTPRDPLAGVLDTRELGEGPRDRASWHPISTSWARAAQPAGPSDHSSWGICPIDPAPPSPHSHPLSSLTS